MSLNILIPKVLNGKIPKMVLMRSCFSKLVDVRDVAKLHVQALTNSKVSGKRFIASGTNPVSFADVAQFLINQVTKVQVLKSLAIQHNFMVFQIYIVFV